MLNSALTGARGRGRQLASTTTVHEQAKSNRACNIFNFAVLGFLYGLTHAIFVKNYDFNVLLNRK
jgi:hypothetical protein